MAKHISVGKPVNESEKWGFDFLVNNLNDSYTIITNVDLYDEYKKPFECDAIIIGEWAVYVVDLKGYQGNLLASKDVWKHNNRIVENPLGKLNHNARVLAGRCKKRLKLRQHAPWCQALVFITGGVGGDITIDTNYHDLPVYNKNNVIDVLTQPSYLTSSFKNQLQKYQKDVAIESLCDFQLINEKKDIIAGYKKIYKIDVNEFYELWNVEQQDFSMDFEYWMKFVDLTKYDLNEAKLLKNLFKKEYRILMELSSVPGIPVVLNYFEDGEKLAIVHQAPSGIPLYQYQFNSHEDIITALQHCAKLLSEIHSKGIIHRNIKQDQIYCDEELNITIANIGTGKSEIAKTVLSSEQLNNKWLSPELLGSNIISTKSDVFTFAVIFSKFLSKSQIQSESTLTFIEEDFKFKLLDQLKESYLDLENWFNAALSIKPENREEFSDLLDIININKKSSENKILIKEGEIIDGKYQLIKCIGTGASSTVWQAKHLIGDFDCSLKIMNEGERYDELAKKEFEVLRLSYHPNIVRTFDLDILADIDSYYISSEYLEGETFDSVELNLNEKEILYFFSNIVSALQYLHRINFVHKDIKPKNIIISKDKAYLIDFNISTLDSRLLGSLSYKDPNVLEKGWVNFSDIYSLVIVVVELLWKQHPYTEFDDIPNKDYKVELNNLSGISSSLKYKFQQVLNHEVDWSAVSDYSGWFGLKKNVEISIPSEIKRKWNISEGYMVKLLTEMLRDMQPRSRNVVVLNTLRSNGIVANKVNKGSASSTISRLKKESIVEEKGKKVMLTEKFLDDWRTHNLS